MRTASAAVDVFFGALAVLAMLAVGCHPSPTEPTVMAQCNEAQNAFERGYAAGRDAGFDEGQAAACPVGEPGPAPEPCPACDVTTNDDQVADRAVAEFVGLITRECSFGSSIVESGDIDGAVKRRIQNLHQYGYCR